ncbi:TPA: DNA ligase, partial [Candidatus Dependentiae bacterium]|nr:DNA ligase [Candidatus Dependentiae bacterium]
RNLLDMSHMFPDLHQAVLCLPYKSLVCEGEALAYDEVSGSYLPFQETVKRRRKHQIDLFAQDKPLRLVLFDLLYKDGESYLDESLKTRYQVLMESAVPCEGSVLQVAEQIFCETPAELESYFLSCIGSGLEGIMAKRPQGKYQPGKRNFNWIKLKRIERGVLDDTIDAVILGYYYGEGRRSGFGIGALLVGIYNKEQDRFESIAKIGTGLSDLEWVAIRELCDQERIESQPHDVFVAPQLWPDVWVAPRIVVVVRADEITKSPVHTAGIKEKTLGFALRFPRFMSLRSDKSSLDATTVEEVVAMHEQQKRVLF